MYRNILVPVDLTDKSLPALAAAKDLAGEGSAVTLLHVIASIEDTPYREMASFFRKIEREAATRLNALAAELRGPGREVQEVVIYGHRAPEIVKYAADHGSDLIVLTSRRLDEKHPAEQWATVSMKVAFLADCQVLLVPA